MRMPMFAAALAVSLMVGAQVSAQRATVPVIPTLPGGGPNGQPPATIVAEPLAMMIAACDSDGDARVTHAELNACLKRSFASIDTAGAGSLGYIGYSDWALKWLGDRNALPSPFTVDASGDNRITLAELETQFDSLFARFDTDKDGTVTRAELLTIRSSAGGDRQGDERGRRRATPPKK